MNQREDIMFSHKKKYFEELPNYYYYYFDEPIKLIS
jgi:hypothetical protein